MKGKFTREREWGEIDRGVRITWMTAEREKDEAKFDGE
jgi:hypothetical protein